ncbi:MAG: glycosyltransferase [Lachnospiraceae bacterium]|nr:glycosyltransferase [Lachnospiraceae bacterium]
MNSGFDEKRTISIVICCYNEEDNIELMYQAVSKEMASFPQYDYEIIFEDNDSEDRSQEILKRICSQDEHVKAILNQCNFGPDRSYVNCLVSSSGDAVISIPCDFQEPPELIPQFIQGWEEGYEIVWGQKVTSKENKISRICRNIYYSVINFFSDYKQLSNVTGFGLVDRRVLDTALITMNQDPLVHIRHIVCEYGFKIKLLPYEQQKRMRGKSSYNIFRYYQFAVTSLCNTSLKPLRIMTVIGMITALLSLLVALIYLIYKLTHWDTFDAGIAPIVIGMFFVAAVQLFCIGLLGEYIGVIMRKITQRPIVLEKGRINFEE